MRTLGLTFVIITLSICVSDSDAATKPSRGGASAPAAGGNAKKGVVRSEKKTKKESGDKSGGLIDPFGDDGKLPGSTGPTPGGTGGGSGGGGKLIDPFAPGNGGTVGGSGGKLIDPFAPGNGGKKKKG